MGCLGWRYTEKVGQRVLFQLQWDQASESPWEGPYKSCGEQNSANSWSRDSEVTMWFSPRLWNTSVSWIPRGNLTQVLNEYWFPSPFQFQGVDLMASSLGTPGVHLDVVLLVSSGSSEYIGVVSSLVNNLIGYCRFNLTHTHGIIIFTIDLCILLCARHTGSDQERPYFLAQARKTESGHLNRLKTTTQRQRSKCQIQCFLWCFSCIFFLFSKVGSKVA